MITDEQKNKLGAVVQRLIAPMNVACEVAVKEEKAGDKDTVVVSISAAEDARFLIGKNGQNVRLASKLTGWKLDVLEIGEREKRKVAKEVKTKGEKTKKAAKEKKEKKTTKEEKPAKKEKAKVEKKTKKTSKKADKTEV